jgi:hypothetical protein
MQRIVFVSSDVVGGGVVMNGSTNDKYMALDRLIGRNRVSLSAKLHTFV